MKVQLLSSCPVQRLNLIKYIKKKQGYEEAIPFTNSLSVCDQYRIESMKVGGGTKQTYKYGKILLKIIIVIMDDKTYSVIMKPTSNLV